MVDGKNNDRMEKLKVFTHAGIHKLFFAKEF